MSSESQATPVGIYVHIPYCQTRCSYCDFATFEHGIKKNGYIEPTEYVDLVCSEIQARAGVWTQQNLTSIYFGGGTPSLIDHQLIKKILESIKQVGLKISPKTEITLEINPETLTEAKLDHYVDYGINRFSVGAQTFHPKILTQIGRHHGPEQIKKTLNLLRKCSLNYTFDLLFALPGQSLEDLKEDLNVIGEFSPPHLSAYCLTIPNGHPLDVSRPIEDDQVKMFSVIESSLKELGLSKYEISNFARSGFESKHNLLYWQDCEYLGVGLSAHSHLFNSDFGTRLGNAKTFPGYKEFIKKLSLDAQTEPAWFEALNFEEALTDFCHVSFRLTEGLSMDKLRYRFGVSGVENVLKRTENLLKKGFICSTESGFRLTQRGELLSNQVFQELLFSK